MELIFDIFYETNHKSFQNSLNLLWMDQNCYFQNDVNFGCVEYSNLLNVVIVAIHEEN